MPAVAVEPRPAALDGAHLGALRMVARGDIGGYDTASVLRHRTDDLPAVVISALFTLRRDGFIGFGAGVDRRDGWRTAELTSAGQRLLELWLRRGGTSPEDAVRQRDWSVLLRCAHRGELAVTEYDEIAAPEAARTLCHRYRELTAAGHLRVGEARVRGLRLVSPTATGRLLHSRLDHVPGLS